MAIKMEQVKKWNGDIKKYNNLFGLDMNALIMHNEKRPCAIVYTNKEQTEHILAQLWYTDERDGYKYTGMKKAQLHLSYWYSEPESTFSRSHGMGYTMDIGEVQKRANFSYLCKLTADITAQQIVDLAIEHGVYKNTNGRIL